MVSMFVVFANGMNAKDADMMQCIWTQMQIGPFLMRICNLVYPILSPNPSQAEVTLQAPSE